MKPKAGAISGDGETGAAHALFPAVSKEVLRGKHGNYARISQPKQTNILEMLV